MRILVTGGSGFIGSALVNRLVLELGHDVLNVDALTYAANPASLRELEAHPHYRLAIADICDGPRMQMLLRDFNPQAVMHLAAESHVDRSISAPGAFVQTNVVGTQILLDAVRSHYDGLSGALRAGFRFLHVSTDEVFGSLGPTGHFSEATRYDPHSPYSASKAASDHLVRAWGDTYGLPILISNCSNNYSPRQFPEKLIPLMAINAFEAKPLPVYGDGLNIRDWLHVDDHARALTTILERGRIGETYVVGGRAEKANIDIVRMLCAMCDDLFPDKAPHDRLITYVPDRPGHDRRYAIDPTKIETELGWRPQAQFETALRETVCWYRDHADWWEPIRAGVYRGERLGLSST